MIEKLWLGSFEDHKQALTFADSVNDKHGQIIDSNLSKFAGVRIDYVLQYAYLQEYKQAKPTMNWFGKWVMREAGTHYRVIAECVAVPSLVDRSEYLKARRLDNWSITTVTERAA